MDIRKIKLGKHDIPVIEYRRDLNSGDFEDTVFNGCEHSHEVLDALNEFVETAARHLYLDSRWEDLGKVKNIRLEYSEAYSVAISLSATFEQSNGVGFTPTINTPLLHYSVLSREDEQRIDSLLKIVRTYMKRQPEQAELRLVS